MKNDKIIQFKDIPTDTINKYCIHVVSTPVDSIYIYNPSFVNIDITHDLVIIDRLYTFVFKSPKFIIRIWKEQTILHITIL